MLEAALNTTLAKCGSVASLTIINLLHEADNNIILSCADLYVSSKEKIFFDCCLVIRTRTKCVLPTCTDFTCFFKLSFVNDWQSQWGQKCLMPSCTACVPIQTPFVLVNSHNEDHHEQTYGCLDFLMRCLMITMRTRVFNIIMNWFHMYPQNILFL